MNKYFLLIILCLGLLLTSCHLFENEKEDHDFSIEISPSESVISAGEDLSLEVKIEDVEDLYAMSVEIVFDSAVLALSDSPFVVSEDWGEDVFTTSINDLDRLNVAIGLNGSNTGCISGDRSLFTVHFTGVAAGETMVSIHNLNLINEEGNPVEDFEDIEIENATVIVQ
ncbi:MAG TPA: cohesin domain-containing protein [Candidatus Cloacimonadota bacterium]|nr:cohesin domain-containing protein [Candidatus Cloacimonadota bacterium]